MLLLGAGCTWGKQEEVKPVASPEFKEKYEDADYGFSFRFPGYMETHLRDKDTRAYKYLGLDVDFFLSLRDTVREDKPISLAYFYAAKGLTTDGFVEAIKNNKDEVKSIEDVELGGVAAKRIVSTTQTAGLEKTHYVFERNESLIIVSVFLEEEKAVELVLGTMSAN